MRILAKLFAAGVIVFALLQLVRPSIPAKPATAEVQAPPEVKHILEKSCYSCHSDHAAVDTTFVQFYPTLLPIAKSKQTLSAAYLKELPTQK